MRSALLLALICMSPACDFFDDDSGDGTYIAIDDLASAYKDAYCTYAAKCGLFPDKAACVSAALSTSPFFDPEVLAGVRAGKIAFNGNNARKCFDAIAAATCDRSDEDSRVTPPACSQFFTGIGRQDDPCFVDQECVSGFCSGGSTTTCSAGQCVGDTAPVPQQPAAIGEMCFSSSGCVSGAYCDTQQVEPVCVALKAQGATCVSDTECTYGTRCSGTTGARTCKPLPGLNQSCDVDFLCRDDGLYCDTTTATPTCKQVGLPPATCTSSSQCSNYYPCDLSTGKCTKAPSIGQSCASTFTCFDAGTYCDTTTSVCTAVKADGSACTADSQCASNNCDTTLTSPICTSPATCN